MEGSRHKVYVIINPISGVRRRGLDGFMQQIRATLDASRFEPEFHVTRYARHAVELAGEGLASGVRYFMVAGGDGTVNEVAGVLTGTEGVMVIIPAGSGNGLARHLRVPARINEAVNLLNRAKISKIDTCSVNDAFFVSIAGIGFDARVARQFAQSRQRGFHTYARIIIKEYFTYKPRSYTLAPDGVTLRASAFFISFANSSQFGYNTRIAPHASITDGLIDVCIVRKPPVRALPWIAHLVYWRKVDRSKYMEVHQASSIRVLREKGKTVNIDGEAMKIEGELNIKIRPASLSVVVP